MGAVSVFTVGNYLNQPSVVFLLCEMLSPSCVVSSVDFFSVEVSFVVVLFDVIFYYTSSMIERSSVVTGRCPQRKWRQFCSETGGIGVNRRRASVLKYGRASSRFNRRRWCLNSVVSDLEYTKMVSR